LVVTVHPAVMADQAVQLTAEAVDPQVMAVQAATVAQQQAELAAETTTVTKQH
jgi:hypothetical protein